MALCSMQQKVSHMQVTDEKNATSERAICGKDKGFWFPKTTTNIVGEGEGAWISLGQNLKIFKVSKTEIRSLSKRQNMADPLSSGGQASEAKIYACNHEGVSTTSACA